jgi:hypothetical protein
LPGGGGLTAPYTRSNRPLWTAGFRVVSAVVGACVLKLLVEFVPRTSSTPVATWFWQTEGRNAECVILGVRPSEFILSEFQSPSRRIFIGSHSLPPPLWSTNRSFTKYTKDIMRKFKMEDTKAMVTPMSTTTALDVDEEGEHVDLKDYRGMIGSLLYLTATRPDILFSVCLCARFQASPRTSHRQAVKRIFRYLRHTPDFGLWYFASSSLALQCFLDADFAGCRLDRKSTSGT